MTKMIKLKLTRQNLILGQCKGIFFFFWEKDNCFHIIQITGKSVDTLEIKFGETNSIQTCKGEESLTLYTKANATMLPSLTSWEKEKLCNSLHKTKPVL